MNFLQLKYILFESPWRRYKSKLDVERAAFTRSVNRSTIGAKHRIISSRLDVCNRNRHFRRFAWKKAFVFTSD